MKILYFYQYFATSEGAWGTRVYEFARRWVEQGHHVVVVTSIYSKSDLKSEQLVSNQLVDGIEVKVINVLIDNRQSTIRRILSFLQFAIISSWFALSIRADIVIASSGPITVGIPGLIARWFRGRRLVFEARDLWPEGAVRMGLLKGKVPIGLAYWFEKRCYKNSSAIVALSPGIQHDIAARFPLCVVESVTNAANISLFATPVMDFQDRQLGTYAIYFGNIGQVNHSDYLLDAAKLLLNQGRVDIKIVLIGDGQLKSRLQKRAIDERIVNIVFLDLMPKTKLIGYIQHAMASVIPLKPIPVFDTSSPNKLFESMAAGIPVIQTTQGWIKDFLKEHDAGLTVDGRMPQELASVLIALKDSPDLATGIGKRGQEVARKYFDKDYLADKMMEILKRTYASN